MENLFIDKNYKSRLSLRDTERAIKLCKDTFEEKLAEKLNLERISAPLFVKTNSGLNDDLSGYERAVNFDVKKIKDVDVSIVHSLAKWKRVALLNYGFSDGEGLYTDMNAIRRDDTLDNIHSIYVDQWDWEKVISRKSRTKEYLESVVKDIVSAICETLDKVKAKFPQITLSLKKEVFFITSQELEDIYPDLTQKQREYEITKKHKTVFIECIGDVLNSGEVHDMRAPDYDDWNLNGDLLFYDDIISSQLEISSMGIRVDEKSLKEQLEKSGKTERMKFDYHQKIISGDLPLTIGGGIGQSRLCMLLLQKIHIGEVQVSIWPDEMIEECSENNILIL